MTEEQKRARNSQLAKDVHEQNLRRIERASRAAKNPDAVMHELMEERKRQASNLRQS